MISLRLKFAAAIMGLVTATMAFTGSFVVKQVKKELLAEMLKRVKVLATNMAATSEEALLTKDDLTLGVSLDKMAEDKSIRYAMILDAAGRVLSHSDRSVAKGTMLSDSHTQAALDSQEMVIQSQEGLYDVSAPIMVLQKRLGILRIGFSDAEILSSLQRTKRIIWFITLLILAIGIIVSALMVSFITRPLAQLSAGVEALGQGHLEHRISVTTRDELGQFAQAFNLMTEKLQNAQERLLEQERFKQELKIAHTIQQSLLPKESPKMEGYEVEPYYLAAKEIGGDYYDFVPLNSHQWAIVIADVSGKGVPGSLGMAIARSIFRSQVQEHRSAQEVLLKTNERIYSEIKRGIFVSMFLAILDTKEHTLDCSSAGHNPPLLIHQGSTQWLRLGGLALGVDKGSLFGKNIKSQCYRLEPGDKLLLYTDGVTEAKDPGDQEFGEDRLQAIVSQGAAGGAQKTVEDICQAVDQFVQGTPQSDDITLICLRRK